MRPYIICSLLVVTLALTSCLGPQEQPVSQEEARVMAQKINSAIASKSDETFLGFIQLDVFTERISRASGKEIPGSFKKGLKAGLKNANLGGQIIEALKDKGSYELIKQYEKNKIQHLLFRMYSEGGFNYHDYELTKVGGKVYIADIFIYLTGENFSKSASEILAGIEEADDLQKYKREDIEKFKRLNGLIASSRFEEAKTLYDKLPATFRDKKVVQINYLSIAAGLGGEEYEKALTDFEARYSNEPNMGISLIDGYVYTKQFDRALNVINQLDSMVGKDEMLDYIRYLLYNQMDKPEEARQALENVNHHYPAFEDASIELIYLYCEVQEYEKARPLVKAYRANEEFDQEKLDEVLDLFSKFTVEEK
jgi:thioredoxin-like negative regulator of GroEL